MTSRPPFDREVAFALSARSDIVTDLFPEDIAPLRARAVDPHPGPLGDGRMTLRRLAVRGRDGREIVILLGYPTDADAPVPVLFHVHGGGLVVGRASDDLPAAAEVAVVLGMAVAAVEYRLAPENPYPAAIDDVYEGVLGLAENAAEWGLDADRIVLSGVSAGGGLAAATALRIRDQGGPVLLGQLLQCPMLDDRNDSASARQMAGAGAWDRRANETAWSAYLGEDRRNVPIYAAPGRADDLSGLPPTFLDAGSAETFRDEIQSYADRLWAAGGDAELHVWAGGAHGFDALVPDALISRAAIAARVSWLRRLLVRAADRTGDNSVRVATTP